MLSNLIKLIDRETGQTSYELIKDLKSGFTAFMWQGVAKLFGTNLKDNYDPNENETDDMIEEIVLDIEAGLIPVKKGKSKPKLRKKFSPIKVNVCSAKLIGRKGRMLRKVGKESLLFLETTRNHKLLATSHMLIESFS